MKVQNFLNRIKLGEQIEQLEPGKWCWSSNRKLTCLEWCITSDPPAGQTKEQVVNNFKEKC